MRPVELELLGLSKKDEDEYYIPVNCPKCGRFVARDAVTTEGMDMNGEIWSRYHCDKCGVVRSS